ncbi:MAG: universal stress protein [Limisphaerales bacterium]
MNKKHILIPLDLVRGSADALVFARQMALENPLTITLLHVVDLNIAPTVSTVSDIYAQLYAESQAALGKLAKLFFGSEQAARIVVRFGKTVDEIVAEAKNEGADMIVLCGPKPAKWLPLFHKGTIHRLLRRVPCPAIVLPHRENSSRVICQGPSEEATAFSRAMIRTTAAAA